MSWAPGESVQVCIMLFNDHEQSSACRRVRGTAAFLPRSQAIGLLHEISVFSTVSFDFDC